MMEESSQNMMSYLVQSAQSGVCTQIEHHAADVVFYTVASYRGVKGWKQSYINVYTRSEV